MSLNTFVSFVPARLAVCALVKVTAQAATEADNEDATANRRIMVLLSLSLSLSGYLSLFLDFPTVHQFIIINLAQTQLAMLGSSTTSHDNCPIVVATVATAAVVACFEFCCWL